MYTSVQYHNFPRCCCCGCQAVSSLPSICAVSVFLSPPFAEWGSCRASSHVQKSYALAYILSARLTGTLDYYRSGGIDPPSITLHLLCLGLLLYSCHNKTKFTRNSYGEHSQTFLRAPGPFGCGAACNFRAGGCLPLPLVGSLQLAWTTANATRQLAKSAPHFWTSAEYLKPPRAVRKPK